LGYYTKIRQHQGEAWQVAPPTHSKNATDSEGLRGEGTNGRHHGVVGRSHALDASDLSVAI